MYKKVIGFFKKYWKEISVSIFVIIFTVPLVMAGLISFGSLFSFADGSSSAWIGFWGSYLGGVIGTAGVIYVAYLQNKAQLKNLKKVENFNRERQKIETQLRMLESYISNLDTVVSELFELKTMLVELVGFKSLVEIFKETDELPNLSEDLQRQKDLMDREYKETKSKFQKYNNGYFINTFNNISYRNTVIFHREDNISTDSMDFSNEIDSMIRTINSKLKDLNIDDLLKTYGDESIKSKKFICVEEAWDWVRDEQALVHERMKDLINELEDIEIEN